MPTLWYRISYRHRAEGRCTPEQYMSYSQGRWWVMKRYDLPKPVCSDELWCHCLDSMIRLVSRYIVSTLPINHSNRSRFAHWYYCFLSIRCPFHWGGLWLGSSRAYRYLLFSSNAVNDKRAVFYRRFDVSSRNGWSKSYFWIISFEFTPLGNIFELHLLVIHKA